MHNNRIQLTVISVTFFAKAKKPPLITAADAGVRKIARTLLFGYKYRHILKKLCVMLRVNFPRLKGE
jgi:hypothetical protein